MGSSECQTYCLRWNNHKSNLVSILDALIKMESYVDCTIYVDNQIQFKAHRVILAANSPYFQTILQDVPMDHCSILFPGVQEFEMRALLEYMYTGEVNVTQSQIPRIMKIAEQLEVKGLFDMHDFKDKFEKLDEPIHHNNHNNHHNPSYNHLHHLHHNNSNSNNTTSAATTSTTSAGHTTKASNNQQSPPIISTSTNISSAQSSSSSPPYSYKSPYSSLYSPSAAERMPQWPPSIAAHLPTTMPTQHLQSTAAAMLSSVYESGSDMNPLKRKKLSSISSMLMSRDTPILRNVLAQPNVADSSQSIPLDYKNQSSISGERERGSDRERSSSHSNGNADYSDRKLKYEEPHSPHTDKSFEDDAMESPQNYLNDSRLAQYVPSSQQKPEWKRYKQYTRNDILSAIECVRNGMSALQASRKFGVPSRTLYDKVKKLGITTGRPMNRTMKRSPSSGSSPASFPYGISGTSSPYSHHMGEGQSHAQQHDRDSERDRDRGDREHHSTIPHPAAALLDATFLQQALEARGGDIAGREALHAMAFVAVAHAAVNGISTSPGTHGTARSPSPNILMKYMRQNASPVELEKENNHNNHHNNHPPHHHQIPMDDDEVEDLSMSKNKSASPRMRISETPSPAPTMMEPPPEATSSDSQSPLPTSQGVIVPPMITKVPQPPLSSSLDNEDRSESVSPPPIDTTKRCVVDFVKTEDDSRD